MTSTCQSLLRIDRSRLIEDLELTTTEEPADVAASAGSNVITVDRIAQDRVARPALGVHTNRVEGGPVAHASSRSAGVCPGAVRDTPAGRYGTRNAQPGVQVTPPSTLTRQ